MTIIFALVGLLVGAATSSWGGAIAGGFIGALCAQIMELKERLRKIERAATEGAVVSQNVARPVAGGADKSAEIKPTPASMAATSMYAAPTLAVEARDASQPIAATTSVPTPTPTPAVNTAINAAPTATQDSATTRSSHEQGTAQQAAAQRSYAPSSRDVDDAPLVRWVRGFFTGGNAVVRISIVVLFFGVAFLLQYAVEHNRLPIELRLVGAVLLAIVFLVIGWRLRHKRSGFALALQGGATGMLYLVIFAALKIYAVLPTPLAFGLLLAVVLLSAMLAVLQDSLWLAVLGMSGGFLAPVLTSSGQGNYVMLFSFYTVLNIGILAIAWFKSWRVLNVLGFLFTFVIGTTWGVLDYQPAYFASTEPFLILFFLFYVAIAVLFASRQPLQLKGYVDGTLVFGVPVTAFALQSAMLREQAYALSASAMAVAVLYLGLAWTLWRKRDHWRLLVEAFIALSITFATLAIPLALNGRWSAATWALEGAALIWIGCRQSRLLPRIAGAVLQFAAALMLWRDASSLFTGLPLLNSTFLGAGLLGAAGIFSSHVLYRFTDRLHFAERPLAAIAFWWGWGWWLLVGLGEIDSNIFVLSESRTSLLFVAFSCVLASVVHKRLAIRTARWAALLLLPALMLFTINDSVLLAHPTAEFGWLTWPLAWIAWYWLAHRHEGEPQTIVAKTVQVCSYWLLLIQLSWESGWIIDYGVNGADVWQLIAWAIVPATAVSCAAWLERRLSWPFAAHHHAYTKIANTGVVIYLLLWSLTVAMPHTAAAQPLPYLPLLNPLDLTQAFVLLTLFSWWRRLAAEHSKDWIPTAQQCWGVLGALTFLWLNAVLLRSVHHWVGVPYDFFYLWNSTVAQAALSILWTVLALALVWTAARRGWRVVWFVGSALLAAELCKLFFVDLSNSGSVARIVSFMGVGVLGVLIGYVSPLPPTQQESK